MKFFPRLGNGYVEVDSIKDASNYLSIKFMTLIWYCILWIAGFTFGCFCIYYVLEHFDRILYFLADILKKLAEQ